MINKILAQITKSFNSILNSGVYYKPYGHGLIAPIFKYGYKPEPANCRGIAINSLSILVSVCLQERVEDLQQNENFLSPSQAGFTKKL